MNDYYVILTGSKNNAGDFLIKNRAKKLFTALRSDRAIVDLDAWIPFDGSVLELVNNAKALILMGGPALQCTMRPNIYPMTENLGDIKVPIITMGIGWKSESGDWSDTYTYPLSKETLELLDRIQNSGYLSSVRDYHTLNTLTFKGFDKFLMTGCPAYYDIDSIGKRVKIDQNIEKVAFSLGVSFTHSASMEKLMKKQILRLKDYFKDSAFEVVFHHALDPVVYMNTHGYTQTHNHRHNQFAQWLQQNNITFVDISGSAENLINYYNSVDLHVGYRVHAHIFMNSLSKMSVLIAEDGRGKATRNVIGGMVIDGFSKLNTSLISKVFSRLIGLYDSYSPNPYTIEEIITNLEYEARNGNHKLKISREMIDQNYLVMKQFLENLP